MPGSAEQPRLRQRDEWARAGDRMFDGVADKGVAQRQDYNQQQNAEAQAGIAFPKQADDQQEQGGKEKGVVAQNWHEPVEDRVGQGLVDEIKQARIERLQPVHGRQGSKTLRIDKTELRKHWLTFFCDGL